MYNFNPQTLKYIKKSPKNPKQWLYGQQTAIICTIGAWEKGPWAHWQNIVQVQLSNMKKLQARKWKDLLMCSFQTYSGSLAIKKKKKKEQRRLKLGMHRPHQNKGITYIVRCLGTTLHHSNCAQGKPRRNVSCNSAHTPRRNIIRNNNLFAVRNFRRQ